jgi:hypothetical protein
LGVSHFRALGGLLYRICRVFQRPKTARSRGGNIHECIRNTHLSACAEARPLPKVRPAQYSLRGESLKC